MYARMLKKQNQAILQVWKFSQHLFYYPAEVVKYSFLPFTLILHLNKNKSEILSTIASVVEKFFARKLQNVFF